MTRRMLARAPGFCPLSRREALVFEENISKGKMLVIAFQHVLTMTPGTIAVPLLLASGLGLDAQTTSFLVAANFFTSGITTLLQVIGIGKLIGSRYPIILGSSFAPLAPMIMVGTRYGLPALFGSIIASGAIIFLLSFFMDKVMKLFPQVVVGTSIAIGVGSLYASEVYANLPEAISMVMSNGLFMVTLSAVVLNLLLNGKKALSVDE